MRILYNSTNHDVVCTDQDVEYTDHDVVYIFHGDNLEIDEIVIIFVYSKKNFFYLKIRTIVLITIVDYPLDLRVGHKKGKQLNTNHFPFIKSGYQDSNLGPPAPKAGALTGLRYIPKCFYNNPFCLFVVGVAGFEPTTPCSQSRCANRTALHPATF